MARSKAEPTMAREFGNWLVYQRNQREMSVQQAAAYSGIIQHRWEEIESGFHSVKRNELQKIARLFDLPLEEVQERAGLPAPETRDRTLRLAIGQRIKARREFLSRTQQDIAEALGLIRPTYAAYENGNSEVAATMLARIGDVLNVSPDYFYGPPVYSLTSPSDPATKADIAQLSNRLAAIEGQLERIQKLLEETLSQK